MNRRSSRMGKLKKENTLLNYFRVQNTYVKEEIMIPDVPEYQEHCDLVAVTNQSEKVNIENELSDVDEIDIMSEYQEHCDLVADTNQLEKVNIENELSDVDEIDIMSEYDTNLFIQKHRIKEKNIISDKNDIKISTKEDLVTKQSNSIEKVTVADTSGTLDIKIHETKKLCSKINNGSNSNKKSKIDSKTVKTSKKPTDPQKNIKAYCIVCDEHAPVVYRQPRCQNCKTLFYYKCLICGKTYKSYSILQDHFKAKHTTKNVHECPDCLNKFCSDKGLATHRKYCTREADLFCDSCSYATKHKADMRRHMISKHSNFDLQCKRCKKRYNSIKSLDRHKKLYCGKKKKFSCDKCGWKVYRKDQLPQHMISRHKILSSKRLK